MGLVPLAVLAIFMVACGAAGTPVVQASPTVAATLTPTPIPPSTPEPTPTPVPTPTMYTLSGQIRTTTGAILQRAGIHYYNDRPNFCAEQLAAARAGRPLSSTPGGPTAGGAYDIRVQPGKYWLVLVVHDPGWTSQYWNGSQKPNDCDAGAPALDLTQGNKVVNFTVQPGY